MAALITYTGGFGLFDVMGAFSQGIEDASTRLAAMRTRRNTIAAKVTSANYVRIANTLASLDTRIAEHQRLMADYRADAITTLIEMVHAVIPLTEKTLFNALKAMIGDMTANGIYVTANGPTVGSIVTGHADGSANTGNGTILLSLLDEFGLAFDYIPACTVAVECTQDAQSGDDGAIETFMVSAQVERDGLDPDWPGGPGLIQPSSSIAATVGQQQSTMRNALKSSTFGTYSVANVPDDFAAVAGVPGTDIFSDATKAYVAPNSLQIKGTTASTLQQTLNSSAANGTVGDLIGSRRYVIGAAFDKNTATAGVIQLGVVDGSNALIDGGAAKLDVSLAPLAAGFNIKLGTFKTPAVLPATRKAQIKLTTALGGAGELANVANMVLAPMHKLSAGGPHLAIVRGSAKCVIGDRWTVPITNAFTAKHQRGFERLFGMRRMGLMLPTAGSTLIAEALVA